MNTAEILVRCMECCGVCIS